MPSASTSVEGHFRGECSQIDFNNEVNDKHKKFKETGTREEFKPNTVNWDTKEVSAEKISSDRPVDPVVICLYCCFFLLFLLCFGFCWRF